MNELLNICNIFLKLNVYVRLKEKCLKVQKYKTTNRFQIARKELGIKTKLCSCKKFCSEDFENTRGKRVFVLVDSFVDLPGNEKKYNLKK